MFGKSPIEKAFYKDMLANGIPVLETATAELIYDHLTKAAVDLGFYDIRLNNEGSLEILNTQGVHCVTIKKQNDNEQYKLIFYTSDYDRAYDNAELVGRLLFLVVSICASENLLSLKSNRAQEENFDFDSDFV